MADGPRPGELLFADDTGVRIRSLAAPDRLVLEPSATRVWEDLMLLDESRYLLLSWSHGVVVVDISRKEMVGELETGPNGRLSPWDDEGSVLVWPFSFMGQARGEILPIGRSLARKIGRGVSNIEAGLTAHRQLQIKLKH